MTLPTFIVFGAARCGTTSLYHHLREHPEVFMSPVKEPRFFESARGAPPDRAAYEALFDGAGDALAVGEATPTYMRVRAVPERVRALLPDVRLVAILRDPVERAYSSYLGLKRDGLRTPPTFEAALLEQERRRDPEGVRGGMILTGRYHEHLVRWYALFPREQIRVFLHDDLRDDPHALLAELFGFIGVDPSYVAEVGERHGETGRVANPILRPLWERSEGLRRATRPLVPPRLGRAAHRRLTRDLVRPPMADETRARLRETFRPDILALQDLIGRDLSRWLAETR